jgi:hypothetical protein
MKTAKPSITPSPDDLKQQHRKQTLWQIYVPLGVSVLFFLFLSGLAITGQTEGVARWGRISLIFLIMPVMIATLVLLVLLMAGVYFQAKLIKVTPLYMHKAQAYVFIAATKIYELANKIAQPVLVSYGWAASWRKFWSRFGFNKSA